ncbi:cystatin type cysteine proteinase inhibitor [Trichuris trichiura]|uniref:Cystatin type cysteine proteinase inhibitor n=1 Tax=Trichuris trichiura TaxID=36087 RepID=A0A077ZLF4_TRITR|nr:cystatin type cysteine proteinase inhibitor [Trichuris trichiura]
MAIPALLFMVALAVSNAILIGGPSTMDPTSTTAKDIAHKALADRNAKSNDLYHDTLIKIVEVTSQVVNGINYNMKIEVLLGGWSPLDVKSEEAKKVAHKSLADRNSKSNSVNHDMLIKIVDASTQVVAGANYKMDVYIGPSNCAKKDVCRKLD